MSVNPESAGLYVLWVGGPRSPASVPGTLVQSAPADLSAAEMLALAPDAIVADAKDAGALAGALERARPDLCIPILALGTPEQRWARRGGVVLRVDPSGDVAGAIAEVLTDRVVSTEHLDGRAGLLVSEDGVHALDARGSVAPAMDGEAQRFVERAPGNVRVLASPIEGDVDLDGARIAILDRSEKHESLEHALIDAGAQAAVESEAAAARSMDPSVIIVRASELSGPIGLALAGDARLASSPLLVLDGELDTESVCAAATALCSRELWASRRLIAGARVVDRIEALGAARWLKIAGRSTGESTMSFRSREGIGSLQLAHGKIREASFARDGEVLEGRAAIQALLALNNGTALLGPREEVNKGRPTIAVKEKPKIRRVEPRSAPPSDEHAITLGSEKPVGFPLQEIDPAEESPASAWTWFAVAAALMAIAAGAMRYGGPAEAAQAQELETSTPLIETHRSEPIEGDPPPAPAPADVPALMGQARQAQLARDYVRLQTIAEDILRAHPEHAGAAYYLSLAHLRQHRDDEALEWAQRAQQWDPNDPLPRLLEGDIHRAHARRHLAARAWQGCVEIAPAFEPCRERLDAASTP